MADKTMLLFKNLILLSLLDIWVCVENRPLISMLLWKKVRSWQSEKWKKIEYWMLVLDYNPIWKDLCSDFFIPTCSVPDMVFSFETCCEEFSLTTVFPLYITVLYV